MKDQVLMDYTEVKDGVILEELHKACKKIAPLWPLESSVAVNPYLGLIDQKFESVAQNLSTIGGIQMTLPISFYKQKLEEGQIAYKDLASVLANKKSRQKLDEFISSLKDIEDQEDRVTAIATLVDIATQVTEKDWNRFATSRVSTWAASYFDNGQATWAAADSKLGLFSAWRSEAVVDRTPEISGLKGFRSKVKQLPDNSVEAVKSALKILEVSESALPIYLHRLLLKVGGWAAYAAYLDWDNDLYGGNQGNKVLEFLAVLICWEACVFQCLDQPKLRVKWLIAKKALSAAAVSSKPDKYLATKLILQAAFDLTAQQEIIQKFTNKTPVQEESPTQAKAQAIFCIDVRSEVYRRNLELVDDGVETLGFAGFFAFPINYVPIGHDSGEAQCPALIPTGPTILETMLDKKDHQTAHDSRVNKHQVQQVWKSFKSGAVTCFSFVSPMGLSYLPKLFTDSFGLTRPVPHPDKVGIKASSLKNKSISLEVATHNNQTVGIPMEQRIQMAKTALNAMSLTENFAKFVLIVGHGSTSVNNPHATGLDCGACGGHSGEANAKVAAAVLNDKEVRAQLKAENLHIPDSTVFLACLHDTTTDEVSIFNEAEVPASSQSELLELKKSLAKAGHATRTERAVRMAVEGNTDDAIIGRSKDWSQVRPELGLAGCSAFVVAPRKRTKGIDFGGRSFLHSYEWEKDQGFSILELIMTAPMVVTSWISLQYYASTVDNKNHGAGNKTLHNVTSNIGVLEGFSGDLRVGLPMQSVHDGENYQHEPLKLNVIIEAPIEAMNAILEKHESVRNLCDNGWIHLLAMNEQGKVSHRYAGSLTWQPMA